MGKITKEDRDVKDLKLISIWQSELLGIGEYEGYHEDGGWMYYSEIAKYAGFNKKTLSRYLDRLVLEDKLEVKKDGPRTRRFRPKMWYWRKHFCYMRVDNVIEKDKLDAADAEFLYFVQLASMISEKFDEAQLLIARFKKKRKEKMPKDFRAKN